MESYSEAQQRTIAAALALFAKHGVGGTSLQMIADEVGVTKAAIYHQFKTRDAIAIAVVKTELARLQVAVDAADDSPAGRDRLLVALVDTVVSRRHGIGTIMNDPLIEHFLNSDEQWVVAFKRVGDKVHLIRKNVRYKSSPGPLAASALRFRARIWPPLSRMAM